jgi:hypothetical protein
MILRPRPLAPPSDPHLRSVLFDGTGVAPQPSALDGSTWGHDTVVEVESRHLACLASAFLQSHSIAVSDSVAHGIRRAALAEAAGVASVVASAGRGLDALAAARIPFLVVKGVAMAGLYDPAAPRYMGDIDILVRPEDFQRGYDCMASHGGRTYSDSLRFSAAVAPSVNVTDDRGLQIDLHRAMAPWRWARGLTFDRLRDGSSPVDVNGRAVTTTNPVHSLLITAASMVSDCATPYEKALPWRDVVLLLRKVETEGTVQVLVDEAAATGTAWMLHLVLAALPEAVRPGPIVDRLASPSPLQRASLAVVHDPRIAGRQWSWIFLRWPLRRVVAFERGMFWPSRADLRSQGYASRLAFVKELVIELRSN